MACSYLTLPFSWSIEVPMVFRTIYLFRLFPESTEQGKPAWNYISIATILLTLVSLFSPVGFLICFVFVCALLISHGKKENQIKYVCAALLMLLLANFLLSHFLGESIWEIGADSFQKVRNRGGSFNSRFGSFIASLQAFADKPFFGWGYSGTFTTVTEKYLSQYTAHYTNTPGLVFVVYGGALG